MASSGNRRAAWLLVLGVAALASATACGRDAPESTALPSPPDPSPPAGTEAAAAASEAVPGHVAHLTSESSEHFLPLVEAGRQQQPVASHGGEILVEESASDGQGETQRFSLWNPETDVREPAWASEPGMQDVVTAADGGVVVFVRMGLALPFARWALFVHDLESGESVEIARADPSVADEAAFQPPAPFGFAPYPTLSDGRLAWAEFRMVDGRVERQVLLHDLATGETTVLASVVAGDADLASPTVGGDRAAWVSRRDGARPEAVVHDLATGETETVEGEAVPFAVALDESGERLAWDDQRGGKFLLELESGETEQFAGNEGWGVVAEGKRFTWAPAPAYGGTGGYFDAESGTLHLVEPGAGALVNYTVLLDGWFAWQELRLAPSGAPDFERSGYYFVPLEGGAP
jgi:hypothetical protein